MNMKTTMYYDSGCPVCMRGVRHYRRVDWARRLAWVDLLAEPEALATDDVSFAQAMEHLHVRDRHGVVRTKISRYFTAGQFRVTQPHFTPGRFQPRRV